MRRGLLEMHRAARDFYVRRLHDSPNGWAAAHLSERGLATAVTDESWQIGYAPDAWSELTSHLRGLGFRDEQLLAGGLSAPTMNGYLVDRFRDRIMFTAENIDFEPVGFVGRARSGRIRYLNSPSTEIYHKGQTVVGLSAQRGKLFCGAIPVLVEGPMDAYSVDQVGGRWAGISTGGTAATRQHAVMIRQLSLANQIVVAFDGDIGGRLGAVRSLEALSDVFASVRVAELPSGHDPSSAFQESKAALNECLASARPLVEFAIDVELAKWEPVLDHISGQVNALRAVAPLVRQVPSHRMAQQVAGLAARLNLDTAIVSREVLTPVVRRSARSRSGWKGRDIAPDLTEEPDRGPIP